MTSNLLGKDTSRSNKILGFGEEERESDDPRKLDALKEFFRPELLNRIDEIIIFNDLGEKELSVISKKLLAELRERAAENDITLEISENVAPLLAKRAAKKQQGARPLRREIIKSVESPLAQFILNRSDAKKAIEIFAENDEIKIAEEN